MGTHNYMFQNLMYVVLFVHYMHTILELCIISINNRLSNCSQCSEEYTVNEIALKCREPLPTHMSTCAHLISTCDIRKACHFG